MSSTSSINSDDSYDENYTLPQTTYVPPPRQPATYEPRPPSLEKRRSERRDSIVDVYSKVYGIAKVVLEVMSAFGAAIDTSPTGIKFYIDRVENQVTENSCSKLLVAVEDLFYATYATLNIEIRNLEHCESFHFDIRRLAPNNRLNAKECLPEPDHLKLIFQACKEYMATDIVRGFLNKEIIRQKQAEYVNQTVRLSMEAGHVPKNEKEFRQYIQRLVTDPQSAYCREWTGLNPIYDAAPGMVLGTLSEKYLSILQKEEQAKHMKKRSEKRESTDSEHEERRFIAANREAAYAMLHGRTVGEHRRQEGYMSLSAYVKENLCICFKYCECARKCTLKGGRKCPCSSRLSVICDSHEVDEQECFVEKCADIAADVFDRLSAVKRGANVFQMAMELDMRLDRFHQVIIEYRQQSERAPKDPHQRLSEF
ncbi:hypothetical protein LOZ53_003131 [Ophidiomyces ophidiicola]|nr:hypothetical protein LOZ55_004258 [Ophidiomyces ophidiicola]KAI1990671.1 hypothetical protein LOZ53_003131 [Ophidiomyces ophidiicola]KAI1991327.1 hypothetical protein LOZ54_002205 [Ophidiomyces ophidiicola]KAI1999259.1 hypothetical protein LOZ51_001745 [Ophidiomyces ophidiicola]